MKFAELCRGERSDSMGSNRWGWLLFGAVLVLLACGESLPRVLGQRPASPVPHHVGAGEGITSHSVELPDGRQQITVIDGRNRAIGVYQIDPRSGAISLKSVRNVNWDLQMDEFNSGGNPSPKEIRSLLEQR